MAQISRQKGLRQLIGMLSIAYQNFREPSQRAPSRHGADARDTRPYAGLL